jgi:predicted Ser/Thr protein kinase
LDPESAALERLRVVMSDDTFARRFDLQGEVGRGGMGSVHRAVDRSSGRPVAIKVLHTPGVESRFTLEAEMLERLDHSAIVSYMGHGVTGSGEAYLAMAWIEGESLAERLDRGALSIEDTLEIGSRVAGALAHAHGHDIVHRDVKPSNVMLVDGDPRKATLIDFGVAKDTATTHGLTETGQLIGTPGYMAPEQALGHANIDARTDLFALGAMLYQCLSGRPPFDGRQTMEVLAQLLMREPLALRDLRPEVPPRLAALVVALLEKEPARRTADATKIEVELRTIATALASGDTAALDSAPDVGYVAPSTQTQTAPTVGRPRPIAARVARHTWRRWIVAAAIAGVVGTTGVIVVVARHGDTARSTKAEVHPCEAQGDDACRKGCEDGDGSACRAFGETAYTAAHGDNAKRGVALTSLQRGCELGDARSCTLAAMWARSGASRGDTRYSRDVWVSLFERGCTLRDGSACGLLATYLLQESPANFAQGLALYQRACDADLEADSLASCVRAAEMLDKRREAGDVERAHALRTSACLRGDQRACTQLRSK